MLSKSCFREKETLNKQTTTEHGVNRGGNCLIRGLDKNLEKAKISEKKGFCLFCFFRLLRFAKAETKHSDGKKISCILGWDRLSKVVHSEKNYQTSVLKI